MSTFESHSSLADRSDNGPEQNPETALRRLERASTIKTVTPTSVSLWDLSKPSESESQRITRVKLNRPSREYVKGEVDHRQKVPREDFGPRGKYRSVCKLVGQYKENPSDTHIVALHGTGWLIAKDLVVTAGHVIYDSKDKWGGLSSIKVYIGYNGKDNLNLESRYGKFVATPTEWIKDLSAKYDVGFIKLNSPFKDVDPIPFMATPRTGQREFIGVVGYPGDKDEGEHMYEHFLCADWNLATANENMLEYAIDTCRGQSGAPVLQHPSGECLIAPNRHQCQLRSIGVHAYGGTPNGASVIGPAGSVFEDFVLAVDVRNGATTSPWVKVSIGPGIRQLPKFSTFTVYSPGSTASSQGTPNVRSRNSRDNASDARDNAFFDVGQWSGVQIQLVLKQFRARGIMESSDQGLSTLQIGSDIVTSPKNDDDESTVSPFTSRSDPDGT